MNKSSSTKLVTSAKFSNTASGATNRVGDFVRKLDADGKTIYTSNLRATTTQVDRNFSPVITAKKIAVIAKASAKLKQSLNVVDGVDYRLSGEPITFDESDDGSLPSAMVAYYKPYVIRDAISF